MPNEDVVALKWLIGSVIILVCIFLTITHGSYAWEAQTNLSPEMDDGKAVHIGR